MTSKPSAKVRKNMDMDAEKLAAAQKALGARTETEAVDRALDYVLFQHEVVDAIRGIAAAGGVEDVYGRLEVSRSAAVAERPRKARG